MTQRNNKRGSSALDSLMAGFAAGASAFIIYAMPQPFFEDMVGLSGLPALLSAAQPPLGTMARVAAMAAAGIGSFLLVWLVLRALSKPAPRPEKRSGPVEIEMTPPKLRRADMHPDAPSRRPILAGVDLGPSFDALPTNSADHKDEEASGEEILLPEGEPLYGAEAYGSEAYGEEAGTGGAEAQEEAVEEPVFPPEEPSNFDERSAEKEATAEFELFPAPDLHEGTDDEAPIDACLTDGPDENPFDLAPHSEEPSPDALDPHEDGPVIPELMQRLENGLFRRRRGRWMVPSGDATNGFASSSAVDPVDARLRGAIDELQKLASRGS